MNKFLFFLLLAGAAGARDDVSIEIPKSGWRNSNSESTGFLQQVNYPASSVNVSENQSVYSLIQGEIKNKPKDSTAPDTLIVNGIPMPLRMEEGGKFARPYMFGYGSHNVEIRKADGSSRKRVQFFEANHMAKQAKLSILMSWDSDNTDLDLHVVSPDGEHTYYGQRTAKNGGALDVDVTTGYGPEIYSTPHPVKGTYLIYANYYGSRGESELTTANVTVVTGQNSPEEKVATLVTAMRKPGELNYVYAFTVK